MPGCLNAGSGERPVGTRTRGARAENHGWTGRIGRAEQVLPAVLDAWGIDPAGAVAYLCRNPGMVDTTRTMLTTAGVPPADIHAEEFWMPGATATAN